MELCMASDLKRVSGLWLKDSRSGGKFMSGEAELAIPAGSRLLVFKNTKKTEGDKQPDYILNVAPDDPGYDRGRQSSSGHQRGSQRRPAQRPQSMASTAPSVDAP